MDTSAKYGTKAAGWSEAAYADAARYLAHRAELVRTLGAELQPGDRVLDLACGDGGLADFLPGLRYIGADGSAEMVAAARARGVDAVEADLNAYVPPEPVQATTLFRALYYAADRRAFFRHVASYTETKLVFDLNPRQYAQAEVEADLHAAGFARVATRPFFVPQTRALPGAAVRGLVALERTPVVAPLLLRQRFTILVAALR
jgi:SAM-dependent methyltransferase